MLGLNGRTFVFLITVLAILAASAYVTAYFPGPDFSVYYTAARSLLEGRTDLYSAEFANGPVMDFRYPPGFLLLFLPFTLLPFLVGKFVFAALTISSLVAATRSYWSAFVRVMEGFKYSNLVLILSVLFCLKYVLMALKTLNIHSIVLSIMIISFVFLIKERTRVAAAMMAFAISIKVFPLITLPYFALRRRWAFLFLTAALAFVFFGLPSFYFGLRANVDLHIQWFDHVITPSPFMELNGPPNQSLFGQLERMLTDVKYEDRVVDPNYPKINFAEFETRSVRIIGYAASAIVMALTFLALFWRRRTTNGTDDEPDHADSRWFDGMVFHEFGLVLCMMLLIGPRTNNIYLTALFVPVTALLYTALRNRSLPAVLALLPILLAAVLVPLIPGARMSRWALVIGFDFLATLGAWLGLLVILIRPETPIHKERVSSE